MSSLQASLPFVRHPRRHQTNAVFAFCHWQKFATLFACGALLKAPCSKANGVGSWSFLKQFPVVPGSEVRAAGGAGIHFLVAPTRPLKVYPRRQDPPRELN